MNRVIEASFLPRETPADLPQAGSITGSGRKGKRRILIVDNNTDTTHLVKMLLEKTGDYLVFEENDVTRAQHSARGLRPDMILLDVATAETGGAEIAALIHSDSKPRSMPIIFLASVAATGQKNAGVRFEGHPVLRKPIGVQELIRAIEEYKPGTVCDRFMSPI